MAKTLVIDDEPLFCELLGRKLRAMDHEVAYALTLQDGLLKTDPDGAELAIKSGAWDYIEKPSSISNMILPMVRALQYREIIRAAKPAVALKRERIVGDSPKMQVLLQSVKEEEQEGDIYPP